MFSWTINKIISTQKNEGGGWNRNQYMILTGIVLILTYIVFTVQAESNDDPVIMQYISGYVTGKPDALPYLFGVSYTYFISRLYEFTTNIPWYGLAYVLINTGAVLVICDRFMRRNCTIRNYVCFLCLYVSFFVYQLTNIQFTMVAGLSGAAAIMVVYDVHEEEKIKASDIVLAVIFAFFSYNIRFECSLVMLGVMIYAVLGNIILLRKQNRNQIICLLLCIGVMVISALCNTIYVNTTEWKEYVKLAYERARFMDYEILEYEDDEDIYTSVGWDNDVYYLTRNWCFMDDGTDLETFVTLNIENEKRLAARDSIDKKIRGFLSDIWMFQRKMRWQCIILIGVGLWIIADFIYIMHMKEPKITGYFVYALGFYMIAIVLVLYFLMRGRYNDRSLIMILTCSLVPGINSLSANLNRCCDRKKKINILLGCGLILLVLSSLNKQMRRTLYSYDKWDDIHEYVLEHNDCIYIGDGSLISPDRLFRTFTKEQQPVNYIFWGGWLANSPLYKNHLDANGIQHFGLEDMLDDNRYFIGSDEYIEFLESYYNNRFGKVESKIYYETDDFIVYGFRRSDN